MLKRGSKFNYIILWNRSYLIEKSFIQWISAPFHFVLHCLENVYHCRGVKHANQALACRLSRVLCPIFLALLMMKSKYLVFPRALYSEAVTGYLLPGFSDHTTDTYQQHETVRNVLPASTQRQTAFFFLVSIIVK